jgi:hypothetical protein
VALVMWPNLALACPACRDPRDPNQSAFLLGTIMLSLLPLAMFLSLALYLRRRLRAAEEEQL